jgi:hypothetical protein
MHWKWWRGTSIHDLKYWKVEVGGRDYCNDVFLQSQRIVGLHDENPCENHILKKCIVKYLWNQHPNYGDFIQFFLDWLDVSIILDDIGLSWCFQESKVDLGHGIIG